MSKFTLKTYYNSKQLERYEHRSVPKLIGILEHPDMNRGGECDAWGTPLKYADRFELYDSRGIKLIEGNITDVYAFARQLR